MDNVWQAKRMYALPTIRIKTKFYSTFAPTLEENDDVTKERSYQRCGCHDVNILLGVLSAAVNKEGIFGRSFGKLSLYHESSPNELRLIDFTWIRIMVFSSTRFLHMKIY